MKIIKKAFVMNIILIFLCFSLSACNESGKIWTKYTSQSFSMTVRYELCGEQICFRADIERDGGEDCMRVHFSSPDALRGADGYIDSERCAISLDGIELEGVSAERLLNIPHKLVFSEASALGRVQIDEKRLVFAEVEDGKIYFDAESGALVFAELCGIRCEIINFSPK